MKARLGLCKSRSAKRESSGNEGEVGNEAEEGTYPRPTPNALIVADKLSKFKGIDIAKIRTLLGRKARSNSPKSKVNAISQKVLKRRNISSSRESPSTSYRTRERSQPRKDKEQEQILEPDKLELIKTIAQRKHRLNKDLWEAAEIGDLPRITRLLRPYNIYNL
jgi:hypothetical protein